MNCKLFCLIFAFIQVMGSCVGGNKQEPSFSLEETTAVVKITLQETKTGFTFQGAHATFLPYKEHRTAKIPIDRDTTLFLYYAVFSPQNVYLTITGSQGSSLPLNLFVKGLDTLSIHIKGSSVDEITFNGRLASVNHYYLAKQQHFKHDHSRLLAQNKNSATFSYHAFANLIDSLAQQEKRYLDAYMIKQSLPTWFASVEKAEIYYQSLVNKLNVASYRRFMLRDKTMIPVGYYDFLKNVTLEKEQAIFTTYYPRFIDSYFNYSLNEALQAKEGRSLQEIDEQRRYPLIVKNGLQLADSLLPAGVKDMYKAWLLSFYLLDTKLMTGPEIRKQYAPDFTDPLYLDFITIKAVAATSLKGRDKAPGFILSNERGQLIDLSGYVGKVVYINFWWPGCVPCIKEFPAEEKLIESFRGEPFVLINICLETSKEKWLHAIKKHNLRGVNLFPEGSWENKLKTNYAIQSFPHYTLIDKKGNIVENKTKRPSDPLLKTTLVKLIAQ